MPRIDCFKHIKGNKELEDHFSSIGEDMPEKEQRSEGIRLANEYYVKLHSETNKLNKLLGKPQIKLAIPNNSKQIKAIENEYDEKIKTLENNITNKKSDNGSEKSTTEQANKNESEISKVRQEENVGNDKGNSSKNERPKTDAQFVRAASEMNLAGQLEGQVMQSLLGIKLQRIVLYELLGSGGKANSNSSRMLRAGKRFVGKSIKGELSKKGAFLNSLKGESSKKYDSIDSIVHDIWENLGSLNNEDEIKTIVEDTLISFNSPSQIAEHIYDNFIDSENGIDKAFDDYMMSQLPEGIDPKTGRWIAGYGEAINAIDAMSDEEIDLFFKDQESFFNSDEYKGVEKRVTNKAPEKTALEKAKEARIEAKKKLDARRKGLGAISDQEADAQALFDYHKALVNEAKEYIKEGIDTIEDFAKKIGEAIGKEIQAAWDEATAKIAEIKNPSDMPYTIEEPNDNTANTPPIPPSNEDKQPSQKPNDKNEKIEAILSRVIDGQTYPTYIDLEKGVLLKQDTAITQGEVQDRDVSGNYIQMDMEQYKLVAIETSKALEKALGKDWQNDVVEFMETNGTFKGNIGLKVGVLAVISDNVRLDINIAEVNGDIDELNKLYDFRQRIDSATNLQTRTASQGLNMRRILRDFVKNGFAKHLMDRHILANETTDLINSIQESLDKIHSDKELNSANEDLVPKTKKQTKKQEVKQQSAKDLKNALSIKAEKAGFRDNEDGDSVKKSGESLWQSAQEKIRNVMKKGKC